MLIMKLTFFPQRVTRIAGILYRYICTLPNNMFRFGCTLINCQMCKHVNIVNIHVYFYQAHVLSSRAHRHWQAQADTHTYTDNILCKLISVLGGREKLLIIRLMGTRLSSASLSSNCLCVNVCVCVFVYQRAGAPLSNTQR